MIRRILLGLAGSPDATGAVQSAVDLARRNKAHVTAVTVLGPTGADASPAEREARLRMRKALDLFRRECDTASVDFTALEEKGGSFETLKSLARTRDLTILALRGFFELGIFESLENELVRLFAEGVRPILASTREPREINRILVAYDGTVAAAGAMKRLVQMDLWKSADVRITCFNADEKEGRAIVEPAVAYCKAYGYRARGVVYPDPAEKGILEMAQGGDDDLVVLGVSNRGIFARKLLGDTLLEVIRKTDRPLFLGH